MISNQAGYFVIIQSLIILHPCCALVASLLHPCCIHVAYLLLLAAAETGSLAAHAKYNLLY